MDFVCRLDEGTEQEKLANAVRIVACVNACAGINPEAVPDLLATLRDIVRLHDLGIFREAEHVSLAGSDWPQRLNGARAALQKAGVLS